MASNYFNKAPLLKQFGWKCVYETSSGNSEYAKWIPAVPDEPNADVYVFEGYHNNSGCHIRFVWAESLEEAEKLLHSDHGIPDFYPRNEEQLRVLLECSTGC